MSVGYRPDFIDLFQSHPPPQTAENSAGKKAWERYNVDEEARANQVYPLVNCGDLLPGFMEVQGKSGLSPGAIGPNEQSPAS